jgi:hypothetical protein
MRTASPRPVVCAAVLAIAWLGTEPARAQTGEQVAAAEALFREAKQLIAEGRAAEACAKFEASHKLDPAVGTLLNLADCNEQIGKTASAWAQFLEAETLSRRAGSELRERVARERAAALEPRLMRLAIEVPEQVRVAGLTVKRDGQIIDPAGWGSGFPVDPGEHEVVVTAPGKRDWTRRIVTDREGEQFEVTVTALQDVAPAAEPGPPVQAAAPPAVAAPPAPVAAPAEADDGSAQRTIGFAVGGLGLVGLGVGTAFGLIAKSNWSDANCSQGVCADPEAQQLSEDAGRNADIATVSFAVGAGALALGAVVALAAPGDREVASARRSLQLGTSCSRYKAAVSLAGSF